MQARNRFVKTPAELELIRAAYARPCFSQFRCLTFCYLTEPERIRELLPPPLKPSHRPAVSVWAGHIAESNTVGPVDTGAIFVDARYDDIEGMYALSIPVSTESALTFGRSLYGEPKKLARITLERSGRTARASIERHDIRFLEIEAELTISCEPRVTTAHTFYVKYLPALDGLSFAHAPQLVCVTSEISISHEERGEGSIVVKESRFDPLIDLPVIQPLGAMYSESSNVNKGRVLCEMDAESFLPYAFAAIESPDLVGSDSRNLVGGVSAV